MADLLQNIANPWTPSTVYKVLDVVLDDGKLYQCTENHTSSTQIDLTKFKKYFIADMVKGKNVAENLSDTTVISNNVTSDDTYTYLGIPSTCVLNSNSKVATLNSNLGIKPYEKLDLMINAYNSVITAERRGIIMWHASTGGSVKVNDTTYTSPNNDFTSILLFNKGDRLEYLGPKNAPSWDCKIVYI